MHPVAVKCIKWAVGLLLLGSLSTAFGSELFVRIADYAGANAAPGVWTVDVILTTVRWVTLPLGASLVGAAVVIQALAPYLGWGAGSEVEGDEVEGDEVEGDEVEGDEVEGDEVEGDEVEGDEVRDSERA
jgi:hypothetical protein